MPFRCILVVFAVLEVGAASGCQCSGVNTGVDAAVYGPDYGKSCKAWEDGVTYSDNTKSCQEYGAGDPETGTWCCRAWCYIDAATCNGVETPFYGSFIQRESNEALYYSYTHCDQTAEAVEKNYTTEECPWQGSNDYAPSFVITATVRDFSDSHPHFGCGTGCSEFYHGHTVARPGMVKSSLDAAGKPVLDWGTWWSKRSFAEWYSKPETSTYRLTFKFDTNTGDHVFQSSDYMPVGPGNGLFTSEMRVFFRYNGGEVFTFTGDDDVWIFINGQLVGDLGGCHMALSTSISLDSVAERIGLVKNRNYAVNLFHAERCYGASNFMARMTIRQDQGVCVNQCNVGDGLGWCDLETGSCVCCNGWGGPDCATPTGGWDPSNPLETGCGPGSGPSPTPTFVNRAHGADGVGLFFASLLFQAGVAR